MAFVPPTFRLCTEEMLGPGQEGSPCGLQSALKRSLVITHWRWSEPSAAEDAFPAVEMEIHIQLVLSASEHWRRCH